MAPQIGMVEPDLIYCCPPNLAFGFLWINKEVQYKYLLKDKSVHLSTYKCWTYKRGKYEKLEKGGRRVN